MRVGLRFPRSQARPLRELADQVRRGERRGDVATFEQAELAALTGEPLEVHCNDLDEFKCIAVGYVRHGIVIAGIDTLTSK